MSKRVASLFSVAMALAILAPLNASWRGDEGDSFPFSWYPMFSRARPDPERADYVVAEAADGSRVILNSQLYARGTMNQARRQLLRLASDPRSAARLCRDVAARLGAKEDAELRRAERVRVVRGWFDMKDYFGNGNKKPLREVNYSVCPIPRRSDAGPDAERPAEPDAERSAEPDADSDTEPAP